MLHREDCASNKDADWECDCGVTEYAALQQQVDKDNEMWIRVVSVIEDIRSKATPNGMIAGFMDSLDKALEAKGK